MKQAKENIRKLLNQFGQEELGNRLSNFAIVALMGAVNQELDRIPDMEMVTDADNK